MGLHAWQLRLHLLDMLLRHAFRLDFLNGPDQLSHDHWVRAHLEHDLVQGMGLDAGPVELLKGVGKGEGLLRLQDLRLRVDDLVWSLDLEKVVGMVSEVLTL